ncbi:site-2 protease family protein [Simiduia aestuariiviva]|uniref:Putative peptide zinc metalloprotease protein n=1 Tax=Simiduia aestuariiviva TaxID=1510459 RepID=A0A839USM6_9GAMM|nr:site-2 protease family protein [Simiduia aestuariiviva]MBB3169701.1 putative peptide zinc metalloprotease protein [Simiduia aestuariiviva]
MGLFSKNWYLVEKLTPRIKPQVDVAPQPKRGEIWYTLRDPVAGTVQLFSPQAYQVVGLMNGERSLNDIWTLAGDQLKHDMPTQEDIISLLASLYQADMIYLNVPANARDLFTRRGQKKERKSLQKVYSPISLQIPLFDPTRLLDSLCPVLDPLLKPRVWLLYLAILAWGCFIAVQNFEALTSNMADRLLAAENLMLLWLLYPLIKIIHELGHAYAVRRYGGQVHEVGIMFLVFFPMPYVDASESAVFTDKRQRMMVAAAGIIVELFIAALAVILWSYASDGLSKAILYNIAFMAGVSTLLFNGNPLLKFDAYYILSDYLEIPGLAKKSVSYWGFLVKKYLFGFKELEDPSSDKRERYWLFFYNLFAFCYRIFISISIFLFVAAHYFIAGLVIGIWTLISSWFIPFMKTVSLPFREQVFRVQGRDPKWVVGCTALGLSSLLFLLPMPYSYTTDGVVWPDESRRIYASESGFVAFIERSDSDQVTHEDLLFGLENHELKDSAALLEAQLQEARARVRSAYADRTKSLQLAAEMQRFEEELDSVKSALANTQKYAPASGQLVYQKRPFERDQFIRRGELIGYVIDNKDAKADAAMPLSVRTALPEYQADVVLDRLQGVVVRKAVDRSTTLSAALDTVVPRVSKVLPSAILTETGGGSIVIDPSSTEEIRAVENYITLDVAVTSGKLLRVHERVYIKFQLSPEPLGWRWYRELRQVFIEQLDV